MRMRAARRWAGMTVAVLAVAACGGGSGVDEQAGTSPEPDASTSAEAQPSATAGADGPTPSESFSLRSAYIPLAWAPTELMRGEDTLADHGVDVTWQEVANPGQLVQGFAQGQLDIIPQSVGIAANMYAQGIDFRIVGTGMTVYGQVVVPAGSGIGEVADLAGQRIASATGTSTHAFMVALMEQVHGLDVEEEAELINAATPPDIANLITSGEADAAIMWSPLAETLTSSGDFEVIARQSELWGEAYPDREQMIHIVFLAAPGYLDQHPSAVERLRAGTDEIVELWEADPERVQAIYTDVSEIPPPVIELAYETGPDPLSGLTREQADQIAFQWRLLDEVGYFEQSPDLSDDALAALFVGPDG